MNRERAKELLPILQAFVEGKEIQRRLKDNTFWMSWSFDGFVDAVNYEYRIKREPREFWVGQREGSDRFEVVTFNPIETPSEKRRYEMLSWDWIKVREVLDE